MGITKKDVLDHVNIHMYAADQCPESSDYPRVEFLDLVGFFYVPVGQMELRISEQLMVRLGITEEMLTKAASKNLENEKYDVRTLAEVLEFEPKDNYDRMILNGVRVVRRKDGKLYGAAGIFKRSLLKRVSYRAYSDLYIVPTSKHELLLIPKGVVNGPSTLKVMLAHFIKGPDAVLPGDVLTGSIYLFNRKTGRITYA